MLWPEQKRYVRDVEGGWKVLQKGCYSRSKECRRVSRVVADAVVVGVAVEDDEDQEQQQQKQQQQQPWLETVRTFNVSCPVLSCPET